MPTGLWDECRGGEPRGGYEAFVPEAREYPECPTDPKLVCHKIQNTKYCLKGQRGVTGEIKLP